MNPFTKFLSQWSKDRPLQTFVQHWDVVEALVVRTYRQGHASAQDEADYQAARMWLQANYAAFVEALRPYWEQSKVGGKLDHGDPFAFILAFDRAADFKDNWQAMQHLPAAREALNELLVAQTGGRK